jgi:hypothetical protein
VELGAVFEAVGVRAGCWPGKGIAITTIRSKQRSMVWIADAAISVFLTRLERKHWNRVPPERSLVSPGDVLARRYNSVSLLSDGGLPR